MTCICISNKRYMGNNKINYTWINIGRTYYFECNKNSFNEDVYSIRCDYGQLRYFKSEEFKKCFKTLDDVREEKLNKIL